MKAVRAATPIPALVHRPAPGLVGDTMVFHVLRRKRGSSILPNQYFGYRASLVELWNSNPTKTNTLAPIRVGNNKNPPSLYSWVGKKAHPESQKAAHKMLRTSPKPTLSA